MNQSIKRLIFVSALMISTLASSANVDKLFLDKNYWTNFNWNDIEKSQILLDDRLEVKDVEGRTKNLNYEKFGDVELNGMPFKEAIEKNILLTKNNRKIFLTLKSDEETEESCVKVAHMYEKAFGKNFDVTEYKSGVANLPSLKSSKKYSEWVIGKTNIQVKCTELILDKFYAQVTYSPNIEENRVKKPIKLNCEQTYKLTRNNEVSTAPPLNITILQEEMNVTNADDNLFGTVEELTYSTIKFSYKPKDAKVTITINRMDGTLTGAFVDSKSELTIANYNGTCKKRVSEARKF